MDVGLVCDSCDFFNAMTAVTCASCGTSLSLGATKSQQRPVTAAPAPMGSGGSGAMAASAALAAAPAAAVRKCGNCGADVAGDFKFCGACGTRMDAPAAAAHHGERKTQFFSAMQAPRPKLILIKGDGLDGSTYVLGGTEHIAGRVEGELLFPDDPLLSPRHANFLYGDGKLVVTDEGSVNGVFMRIRAPMALKPGDRFLVGEQLMQVEAPPDEDAGVQPDAEGTHYFASPRTPVKLRLVQILRGGERGRIYSTPSDTLTLGREGNDINFPDDPFISGRHASLKAGIGTITLTDNGSKNGTFLRVTKETPLDHGDYVFMGQQLLRVEIT
ncbi:MAG: FHA domain-containing protein [Deltaproteobacteria bacterium]|nr:FHA domain-containing protein [Deltaproteobacteria bacterium]